jgi:WXG100 family type VII secretion target
MSVGSDFKAPPGDISTAATNCDATASEIGQQLSALAAWVNELEGMWLGIASQTFNELMNDYNVYSTMLQNALTDIGSGLRGNYVNYTDAEQTNINNLQTVNGELPGANFK